MHPKDKLHEQDEEKDEHKRPEQNTPVPKWSYRGKKRKRHGDENEESLGR